MPFYFLQVGVLSKRRQLRLAVRMCPSCKTEMVRLSEDKDDFFLKMDKKVEETIGSIDYDVWFCEKSKDVKYTHTSHYSLVILNALPVTIRHTLFNLTRSLYRRRAPAPGFRYTTICLQNCNYQTALPIYHSCTGMLVNHLVSSGSSYSSSSSSSSSSSFGGGRSGGGGAGGSW